jgi:hypothetical protein
MRLSKAESTQGQRLPPPVGVPPRTATQLVRDGHLLARYTSSASRCVQAQMAAAITIKCTNCVWD